jgi:hypothetical protein
MAIYQLPRLKNEKQFEEFVCDLFNEIEQIGEIRNTQYQLFGVKGQAQKGIDIYSPVSQTVIQCKLKDISKRSATIRKSLMADINADLLATFRLQFEVRRFIVVSTFSDDAPLQEFTLQLQQEAKLPFTLHYWGWDTLCSYAERSDYILKKYFPGHFIKPVKSVKKPPTILPEGALGLDLAKKNYISYLSKRYAEWKQMQLDREGKGEQFHWASHNKSLMNRYHAAGINYIPVTQFDDLQAYLKKKIDNTIFGKSRRAKNITNYSPIEDHAAGIIN